MRREHASPVRAVVLVEGESDRLAVERLAERRGRDLAAEDVHVLPIGGATNIRAEIARFGGVVVVGLCDVGEERCYRRAFAAASLPFFVCDADLEDELIRAIGTDAMRTFIDDQGERAAFAAFQRQPFQRQPDQQGKTAEAQLRRFMGTKSGRKLRYARLLVDALDLTRVPAPLEALLAAV